MVRAACLCLLALLPALPSRACPICFPMPRESAADVLLAADVVVLAREDPDRVCRLKVIGVLKGRIGKDALDVFVDSTTRRILAHFPERAVVLARKGDWRRVAVVDDEGRALVRAILASGPRWTAAERVEFFARRLGHEDAAIRNLAHIEVARASYARIRRLGGVLPREKVRAFLGDARHFEWHGLYILLLAQSGDPRDRRHIVESFRQTTTGQLAAWTTAYVEVGRTDAIAEVESRYFRRRRASDDEARAVLLALSTYGAVAEPPLRDRIVASYRTLLETRPGLASPVLDDLVAWKRDDMAAWMREFGRRHARTLMPDARLKLRRFLGAP